jgi:hypothetical protein
MPRQSKASVAEAAGFNFGSLAVSDTKVVKDTTTPFDEPLYASYLTRNDDEPVAKTVTVPAEHADACVNLIRKAGANLGVGVSVKTSDPVKGQVTVTFRGKDKRRTNANGTTSEVPDDVDNDNADTFEYGSEYTEAATE